VAIIFTIVTALLSWLLYQDWRQRQRLMRELGESRETFRAFAEMASDWFWEQDDAGRLTRVSRGFAVLSGVPVEECIGKTPWELVFALTGKNGEIFERLFQQRAAFEDVEWAFVNRQGKKRSVIINGEPVRDRQGAFAGFRGTGKDMTERKRLEDELIKMAKTDELTGLVNRRHFMELAKNEHRRALRLRQPLALAAIDIDRFKHINDSLGHAAGDQVLQTLATVFLKNIRAIDVFARLGGDEFVLLLPGAHMAQAVEIIERVRRALADAPMQLADQAVSVTISVGVASLAGDDTRFESLMHRADQALYASKEGGRNRVTADEAGMKVVPSESP
jgi:diguanylate cyclase (GGDEF)-like protein/PAS domain S-box-containing protein